MRVAAASLLTGALVALASLATAAPASTEAPVQVLDLGDSLSIGTAPYLAARLRGYRVTQVHDVGLHAYEAANLVVARRSTLPPVLVVSAGTNDDPRIVATFWRAATTIARAAGSQRCVVWPTIRRPVAAGASYDGLNRALRGVAARNRNVVVVDWVGMVRRHPGWLSPDGVHVGAAGYRARAAAIAAAVKTRCSG